MVSVAAIILGGIGLSLLVGYLYAYRKRSYVGLLGASFLALAADVALQPGGLYGREGAQGLKASLLILAILLFLAALFVAYAETKRRLAALRREQQAREQAFRESLQAVAQRQKQESEQEKPQTPSQPGEE